MSGSGRLRIGAGRRTRHGDGVGRCLAGAAVCVAALAAAACDPCAGVVACTASPRLSVSGEIVDRGDPTQSPTDPQSGAGIPEAKPVEGVRVELFPTGGVAVDGPSAVATTDASGWWTMALNARDTGAVTADITVTPPGGSGYRVRAVALRASRTRGEGNVLGRWTHQLFLSVLGEVVNEPSGERPVGARVTATRSGGVDLAPTRNTRNPMVTSGGGRFLHDVRPLADGPVVEDFSIERDGLPTATVRNVVLQPRHEWLPPNVDGALIFHLDSAGNVPNH